MIPNSGNTRRWAPAVVSAFACAAGPCWGRTCSAPVGMAFVAIAARAGPPVPPVAFRGVTLPAHSEPVGENRFRVPLTWAETRKHFAYTYKGAPQKAIVNQPGIRAVHVVNNGPGEWEGLNIYERDNEVRVYILFRTAVAKPVKDRKEVAPVKGT